MSERERGVRESEWLRVHGWANRPRQIVNDMIASQKERDDISIDGGWMIGGDSVRQKY